MFARCFANRLTGLIAAAVSLVAFGSGDASAQLVPADRLPLPGTWESAGVEGGIPQRTTICADVTRPPYSADPTGAVSAVAAIQRALDNCPRRTGRLRAGRLLQN